MSALKCLTVALAAASLLGATAVAQTPPASPPVPDSAKFDLHWAVKIPLRDGVKLNATVYTPTGQTAPAPCIFTLTPYISQSYHNRGEYFAAHGLPFLIVDVRGRGNSEGVFHPMIQEADDGYDVVEWLAKQPYCNGKVSMWGGSYAGYDQWMTASRRPPHLSTIVPVASPDVGVDFPRRNNLAGLYLLQWLFYVGAHTGQDNLFNDGGYWSNLWLKRYDKVEPYANLPTAIDGFDPPALHDWIAHPQIDSYWDAYNPTDAQYRALTLPILTITGSYDGDQPGALSHYRTYMRLATPEQRDSHYLVIGPWDHAATRTPRPDIGGLKFGPASLVDLPALHVAWYNWTMAGGAKPDFLKKHVAYYVMGAETWRYADSLDGVTAEQRPYFLESAGNPTTVFGAGALTPGRPARGGTDHYLYDPRDLTPGRYEAGSDLSSTGDISGFTDQRLVLAMDGKHLVYQTAAFEKDTEISGFFRLKAFIGLDQPDTDFDVSVYEIDQNGQSIFLTNDVMRARYRESLRQAKLVTTKAPLEYDFNRFTFTSRLIPAGARLRVVISPVNSIFSEKNYNSGKPVEQETMSDARPVTVTLFHDAAHPSALYVPFGQPQ